MLSFPSANPALGARYPDPPVPGMAIWQWDGVKWGRVVGNVDAPINGNYYGRKDDVWSNLNSTFARLDSPVFSGTPIAPTTLQSDSSTRLATTEFVQALVSAQLLLATTRINEDHVIDMNDNGTTLIIDASNNDVRLDAAAGLPDSFLVKLVRLDASAHRITCDFTGYRIDGRQQAPLISQYDTATLRKVRATDFLTEAARYPRLYYFYSSETIATFEFDPDSQIPLGCNAIQVVITGGGGGGGAQHTSGWRGNGGGGGGTAIKTISIDDLASDRVVITIGAGGVGGVTNGMDGDPGGTTSFGGFVSATGGEGGRAATGWANDGQGGGNGINGDVNQLGGPSGVTDASGAVINVSGGGMSGGAWGAMQWADVNMSGLLYGGGGSAGNGRGARGQCTVFIL